MTIITKAVINQKKPAPLAAATATPMQAEQGEQPLITDTRTPNTPFRHLEYLMCGVGIMLMLASLTVLFLYAVSGYVDDKSLDSLEDLDADSYFREAFIMNDQLGLQNAENSFLERFKIGNGDRSYAKIDVPDFSDGRRGRFIHDFNMNQTGIMDPEGRRCFIMPLNRSAVLPPRSLLDLIDKMSNGYYDVDMSVVKQTMKVVFPRIRDFSEIGVYITNECSNYPTYRLENYESGIFKRSADINPDLVYLEFAGKGFRKLNIVNMPEVLQYEAENAE